MTKKIDLQPAFDEMVKCGLSEEKAHQEIGFALLQINGNKDLVMVKDKVKLNNAVVQVAYTGLSLSPLKQESVISAYNEKGQRGVFFMPMYRGLLKVAVLDGSIIGANTQVVYKGDNFEIDAASFKKPVRHIVKSFGKDREAIVTYTVLALASGLEQVSLFYEDEYQQLKAGAKNKKSSSPHVQWESEMRKKSCLKRGLKVVPSGKDSKLDHLIALDNLQYNVEPIKQSKEEKAKGLPFLDTNHEKWKGAIQSVVTGKQTLETLKKYVQMKPEIEELFNKEVENAGV